MQFPHFETVDPPGIILAGTGLRRHLYIAFGVELATMHRRPHFHATKAAATQAAGVSLEKDIAPTV